MKQLLFSAVIIFLLQSCGGSSESDKKAEAEKTEAVNDVSSNPDYEKGLALISKSGCLTCHKVDETLIGPPYRKVAEKYAGMPDTIVAHLAGKIITGGKGVWGEVPMTPHPAISQSDAEAMVKYVLLLKK